MLSALACNLFFGVKKLMMFFFRSVNATLDSKATDTLVKISTSVLMTWIFAKTDTVWTILELSGASAKWVSCIPATKTTRLVQVSVERWKIVRFVENDLIMTNDFRYKRVRNVQQSLPARTMRKHLWHVPLRMQRGLPDRQDWRELHRHQRMWKPSGLPIRHLCQSPRQFWVPLSA